MTDLVFRVSLNVSAILELPAWDRVVNKPIGHPQQGRLQFQAVVNVWYVIRKRKKGRLVVLSFPFGLQIDSISMFHCSSFAMVTSCAPYKL